MNISYYLNEKDEYITPCPVAMPYKNPAMVGSPGCHSCQYFQRDYLKTVSCQFFDKKEE